MKVFWTKHALTQLTDIYEYIAKDSKIYAKKVVDIITKSTANLEAYENLGRIVPEINKVNFREIIQGNYRIIYKIKSNRIDILTIIHTSQDFNRQYLPESE